MMSMIEAECLSSIAGEYLAFLLGWDSQVGKECAASIDTAAKAYEHEQFRWRMISAGYDPSRYERLGAT
jgi:hypothetical protein